MSVGLLAARFSGSGINEFLGLKEKAGLRVLSLPDNSTVFLDNQELGQTPFENSDLTPGEHDLQIKAGDLQWQGRIRLVGGTLTVINREIAQDSTSSAGEVLILEKGKGVTIVSSPSEAEVEINGKSYGKTPNSFDLEAGEHIFTLSHGNYLKRSIRAYLPEKYNLTLSVDLALSEADLTNITTPVTSETAKVTVKNSVASNPGFLRVREKPTTSSKEVGRALPGEELIVLEELSSWKRVRLSSGIEGYVSSSYVEKKSAAN